MAKAGKIETAAYKPNARIRCDCCGEMATAKGGAYPHYLCNAHKRLPESEVNRLMRAKYGMPASSRL